MRIPIFLLALSLPASAGAHPFHITFAEAEYNDETGKLEVSVRIYHPGDLETALGIREGQRVSLDRTEDVDAMIASYLREAFRVVPAGQDEPAPIDWVGKEVSIRTAWLYFEVPLPDGPDGVSVSDRLLFEVRPDQVNTLTFRDGRRRASLRFTRDDDSQTLRTPAPAPAAPPSSP